jgi:hypothetical protein
MSIFRVNKTKNYTVLSNHHFKEKDMSLKAKGLLSLMLSLPDDWNYSIAGLVSLSKDGKDSVMAALAELEKFRYLDRVRTTNSKGQFSGVEYNIYEEPQPENPVAEKQNSDNQNAEKSNSEKPPLLNTKFTKNLNNKIIKELNTKEIELEAVLISSVSNETLRDLYRDYIEMREGINAPLTERGLKMLIQRNERLSGLNIEVQKILLETAIINNWKNIYSPNESNAPSYVKENKLLRELHDIYGKPPAE